MNILSKIWKKKNILRSLPFSIYFNFHYLPFRQAIKLPILLYKPDFIACKGKVVIDAPQVKFGMIKMGFRFVSIYPNSGIMWENNGGTVIFNGTARFGNDVYLSFGDKTTVEFGDNFVHKAGMKLVSWRGMKFGKNTRIGWGCLIMDTNIHPLYDIEKKKFKRASGPITIGDNNWFGTGCRIMHSVTTPERCIFGMGTTVTRGCVAQSYCVMGGSPVRVLTENVLRDLSHDKEEL